VYTASLQSLVDELGRLPGIGPKSAQRLAFHILKVANEDALRLAEAIVAVKEHTTLCPLCFNVAEGISARSATTHGATPPSSVWSRIPATSWPSRRPRSSAAAITFCTVHSIPSRASVPISCASASSWPGSRARA